MVGNIKIVMVGALPLDLESVKGGVEAAILNLLSGFSQLNDIEVVHISFIQGLEKIMEVNLASNVKIYFIPFKVNFKILDYFFNKQALKEMVLKEAPDVIHLQESEPHLLRFLDFQKDKIVVTQHGIMREELKYASGVREKLKFLFKTFVEQHIFPAFKNVIFISNYNRKLFRGKLENEINLYNSVNPIFFDHISPLQKNKNTIIYVGVINRRKNLKIVLEALHQLRTMNIIYSLNVVGWYKEKDLSYEADIVGLINKYMLSGQVKFYGWLKQREILQVYDQSTYFILPSLQETLPVSIAEAMALGKIVIASDVGAIAEMFENKVSGFLFKRNDVWDLVKLLESLNHDQISVTDLSPLIKKTAIEKYHPVYVARRTVDFYKHIIAESNSYL